MPNLRQNYGFTPADYLILTCLALLMAAVLAVGSYAIYPTVY